MSRFDVPEKSIRYRVRPICLDGRWRTFVKVYTKEDGYVTQGSMRLIVWDEREHKKRILTLAADGKKWVALAPIEDFFMWLRWARRNNLETKRM